MTHEEIDAARGWIRNALLLSELPTIDKAWVALDTLCAEVERLKSEAVVMRELCEAGDAVGFEGIGDNVPAKVNQRWCAAVAAYRAMKGEK